MTLAKPYPAEVRAEIVRRHEAGESATKIAREIRRSRNEIAAFLKSIGRVVVPCPVKHHFDRDEAIRRYLAGEKLSAIATALGAPWAAVRSTLSNRKIPRRSRSEARRIYTLDESVFDTLTETSAYWIGFLAADGAISENKVTLQLQPRDVGHVEAFRTFLGSNAPIRSRWTTLKGKRHEGRYTQARSDRLIVALARYGVVANKGDTMTAAGGVEESRDFWRGVIDGDGCLSWGISHPGSRPQPVIELCGSPPLIDQFYRWVLGVVPGYGGKPRRKPECKVSMHLRAKGMSATYLIEALYAGCSVALARKLEKAREMLCGSGVNPV